MPLPLIHRGELWVVDLGYLGNGSRTRLEIGKWRLGGSIVSLNESLLPHLARGSTGEPFRLRGRGLAVASSFGRATHCYGSRA
jgi:hypothetical protein